LKREKQFLEICIGIAGSGKTTYAKETAKNTPNTVMISRDDFRFMLEDKPMCSNKVEELITGYVDFAVKNALSVGLNVIVHNTHLSEKYIKVYGKFEKEFDIKLKYTVFTTDFDVCVSRNENRERTVPMNVMVKMQSQLDSLLKSEFYNTVINPPKPEPIILNASLPKAILVDLDGTVALMNGRSPYDGSKCDEDLLNEPVAELVYMYEKMGYKIVFLSGREDKWETQTRTFLERHFSTIKYDLFMRKEKDMRKDSIVKEEIYRTKVVPNYYASISIDDRLQVVKKWAELGVFCLCVNQNLIEF
jgi:predicted kinase